MLILTCDKSIELTTVDACKAINDVQEWDMKLHSVVKLLMMLAQCVTKIKLAKSRYYQNEWYQVSNYPLSCLLSRPVIIKNNATGFNVCPWTGYIIGLCIWCAARQKVHCTLCRFMNLHYFLLNHHCNLFYNNFSYNLNKVGPIYNVFHVLYLIHLLTWKCRQTMISAVLHRK